MDTPAAKKPAAEVAYDGLVKMHAQELESCDRFRRSGRMTDSEVHKVARDLDALGRPHELDATIERILAATDALELQRQACAAAEIDEARTVELQAGTR
jgi:hypothetical protein